MCASPAKKGTPSGVAVDIWVEAFFLLGFLRSAAAKKKVRELEVRNWLSRLNLIFLMY